MAQVSAKKFRDTTSESRNSSAVLTTITKDLGRAAGALNAYLAKVAAEGKGYCHYLLTLKFAIGNDFYYRHKLDNRDLFSINLHF